jgi:hypothetical protein
MIKGANAFFAFVTVTDSIGLECFTDAAVAVGNLFGALFEHELNVVSFTVGESL